ncbi:MAG: type II secretion system protein [Thermodesulfobacteriota bacterium]
MSDERGFTLIEVIIAVAIMGISLGLLISLFASALRTARITEEYSRALILARETLIERLVFSNNGSLKGSSGRVDGYEWELQEVPFKDLEGALGAGKLKLQRVEVSVRWKDDAQTKETALYGLMMTDRYAKEGNL